MAHGGVTARWFPGATGLGWIAGLTILIAAGAAPAVFGRVAEWEWVELRDGGRPHPTLEGLEPLAVTPPAANETGRWAERLGRRFAGLREIARVRVRDANANLLWSTDPRGAAPARDDHPELRSALAGKVSLAVTQPDRPRADGRLPVMVANVYLPIVSAESAAVLGVLELRKSHGHLRDTRLRTLGLLGAVSLGGALAVYLAALPLTSRYARARVGPPRDGAAAPAGADDDPRVRALLTDRLRILGQMTGGVVHDLNNLLGVIVGRTQILLRRPDRLASPDLHAELRTIEQVALDGSRALRQMLDFARGSTFATRAIADLNRVVEEVIELTRPRWHVQARAAGIAYHVEAQTVPVPPIAADASELRLALTNIVFNALDAMPQGGRVRLATYVDGGTACCAVTDTGPGMTEDVERRAFEPFFTTKGEGGTGLGLWTVKAFATRHRGTIEVRTQPGQGTTLVVRLPIVAPASTGAAPPTG